MPMRDCWSSRFQARLLFQSVFYLFFALHALFGNPSAIMELISSHDPAKLRQALDHDAERIRMVDDENCTLLHRAAEAGWLEGIRILVERGAKMDTQNILNFRPLHMAAAAGKTAAIDLLVSLGAPASTDDGRGTSALHTAAVRGKLETCRKLVELGAEINAANTRGETPLHWAVDDGCEQVARYLLEAGADPTAQTSDGNTALDIAKTKGYTAIARDLEIAEKKAIHSGNRRDSDQTRSQNSPGPALPRRAPPADEPLYKEPATLPEPLKIFP